MDGAFLWNMSNGHVGSDNPDAAISHNHARHILLRDMKAVMRALNPRARLGLLENQYMEYMHYADCVVRKGTSIRWDNMPTAPHLRSFRYNGTRKIGRPATVAWRLPRYSSPAKAKPSFGAILPAEYRCAP